MVTRITRSLYRTRSDRVVSRSHASHFTHLHLSDQTRSRKAAGTSSVRRNPYQLVYFLRLHKMSSGQPTDLSRQMQIYMQPNLVLTPEQVATAKTQAELLEKAAALVRQKAEEGARRYQLEQLRKQVEEGERAR